jgi:hypothetical protein
MDYYDDNPLKVNKIVKDIKKMRKEQRKARKALKAQRMTELLAEKEQETLQEYEEYSNEMYEEQVKLTKFRRFSAQDSFNWDELEEELRKENCDESDGSDCDS